jgi:hypothetical protein
MMSYHILHGFVAKFQMSRYSLGPYIVHLFCPERKGPWLKLAHYKENRVAFETGLSMPITLTQLHTLFSPPFLISSPSADSVISLIMIIIHLNKANVKPSPVINLCTCQVCILQMNEVGTRREGHKERTQE